MKFGNLNVEEKFWFSGNEYKKTHTTIRLSGHPSIPVQNALRLKDNRYGHFEFNTGVRATRQQQLDFTKKVKFGSLKAGDAFKWSEVKGDTNPTPYIKKSDVSAYPTNIDQMVHCFFKSNEMVTPMTKKENKPAVLFVATDQKRYNALRNVATSTNRTLDDVAREAFDHYLNAPLNELNAMSVSISPEFKPGETVYEVFYDGDIQAWNVDEYTVKRIVIEVGKDNCPTWAYIVNDVAPELTVNDNDLLFKSHYEASKIAAKKNSNRE